jgi:hypothetical protein
MAMSPDERALLIEIMKILEGLKKKLHELLSR